MPWWASLVLFALGVFVGFMIAALMIAGEDD